MPMGFMIVGGVLLAVGVGLFFVQRHQRHRADCVRLARASSVGELQRMAQEIAREIGGGSWQDYVKVSGEVVCDRPLSAPLSQQPCVYYEMQVQREFEETITERDKEGKTTTQIRRGSEVLSSHKQATPFQLKDDTGVLAVELEGAEIETEKQVDEFRSEQGGALSFGSFSLAVGNAPSGRRTLGYRYRESILPLQRRITVVGMVTDAGDRLRLQQPTSGDQHFLVAMRTAAAITRAAEQQARNFRYICFGCLGLGSLLLLIGLLQAG